jgi:ABC-type phosphate transport system substrate-binding protein
MKCLVTHSTLVLGMGLSSLVLTLALSISLARADIVVVVSSKSSITALTNSQIVDIFLGKRTRFPDGSPATPIDQTEGSVARDEFYARFATMSSAQVTAFWSRIIFTGRGQPPKSVTTGADVKLLVSSNPNAIAYIDAKLVDSNLRVVSPL